MVLVAVPLLLLAHILLLWIYGAKFIAATYIFQLLLGEAILAGMVSILAQLFLALGRPGILTSLESGGLVVTIFLLVLLVPRLGLVGAGIALVCSTLIRLISILVSFPLVLKKSAPNLWPRCGDILSVWIRIRWRVR
jgi:O-antigen/teichoic acid export membrane protein